MALWHIVRTVLAFVLAMNVTAAAAGVHGALAIVVCAVATTAACASHGVPVRRMVTR